MVSIYIADLDKTVKFQVKVHFFNLKEPISTTQFLTKCKFLCDLNKIIQERVAMWVLLQFVNETHPDSLNSRMGADHWVISFAASIHNIKLGSPKLLHPYRRVVTYLLEEYATDQAIDENDAAILGYIQPLNITSTNYAVNLIAKSCTASNLHVENTPNDVIIIVVDVSTSHSLHNYWAPNP